MQNHQLRGAFAHAWSQLLDYPMPGFLATAAKSNSASSSLNAMVMVLLGATLGVCCWIAGGVLIALLPKVAAAVLFAAAATILAVTKDSARGLAAVTSLINHLASNGEARKQPLNDLDTTLRTSPYLLANLAAPVMLGIYFIGFFLMAFFGYAFFAVAVFTADFAAQTYLAMLPKRYGNGPLLELPGVPDTTILITAGIVLLFPFALFPITTLLATLTAAAGVLYLKKLALNQYGGVDSALVTLGGTGAALAMLAIGTLAKL